MIRGTRWGNHVVVGLFVVYALAILFLFLGYSKVQACLSSYSDMSATSTSIRAEAAAQDRALDIREKALDAADRNRLLINQQAMITLLAGEGGPKAIEVFSDSNVESVRIFSANQKARVVIEAARTKVEAQRSSAPPPAPPSETC